jgi:anti-sigma B factor antagonist
MFRRDPAFFSVGGVSPASPPNLHVERTNAPRTLRLSGEVDLSNAGELSLAIDPWLQSDGDIALDLEGVGFMDSTGIGVLMSAAKGLGSRGTLRLVSPGPLVYNVLRLIAADTLPNVEIVTPQIEFEDPPHRQDNSA